jgi:hypothetical protein
MLLTSITTPPLGSVHFGPYAAPTVNEPPNLGD